MPAGPRSPERGRRSLERLAERRGAGWALFVAALAAYAAVSIALPLAEGRDLGRYLVVYAQLFGDRVVYPYALAARPPGTPLVVGSLLEGGPLVAEIGAAVLYAFSVVCWSAVARRFGTAAALVTAVALILYPGYVLLFHRLSSDAVFAAVLAGVAWLLVRSVERPSLGRSAALGGGVAALVLVRPVAQVLLLLVLVPFFAAPSWRLRLQGSAAVALAAIAPLLGWAGHNAVRAEDFTIARGGGATLPLFRVFVADRLVRLDNGPAVEELARTVRRRLLSQEPYRSYRIDLEEFFGSGSARMHEDLTVLSDREWGWDDDYARLGEVGREAVLAHPWAYARGVAGDVRDLLVWPLYVGVPETTAARVAPRRLAQVGWLPLPSEGEPIPAARQSSYISTPDGRIREVWTSPTEHQVVFSDARDAARAAEIDRDVDRLLAALPDRAAHARAVEWLNSASRWYPRPVLWLALGLLAALLRRKRWLAVPLLLSGAALLVLVATSLAVYAVAEYSVPVVPAFVVLAAVSVLGRPPETDL